MEEGNSSPFSVILEDELSEEENDYRNRGDEISFEEVAGQEDDNSDNNNAEDIGSTDSSSEDNDSDTEEDNYSNYLPLLQSVIQADWNSTQEFLNLYPDAITAGITTSSKTALSVAVGRGTSIEYVNNLINLMSIEQLQVTNGNCTVLHEAAAYGNLKAAMLLVEKNPGLTLVRDSDNEVPLNKAAYYGHRSMILYLLQVTRDDVESSPYQGDIGLDILNYIIISGFYDIALYLIERYPGLATFESSRHRTALKNLAEKPSAFYSGTQLNIWQQIIYFYVPLKPEKFSLHPIGEDEETRPTNMFQQRAQSLSGLMKTLFWEFTERSVPAIKRVKEIKHMHDQSLQLLKSLCKEVLSLDSARYSKIFQSTIFMAAENGTHEIIEEIGELYPLIILFRDDKERYIFAKAVMKRHENVFNLIYQMSDYKSLALDKKDIEGNNMLHLTAKLAPIHQLDRINGAVLQMQRELQWFKEVEKLVRYSFKHKLNDRRQTPGKKFTDEHTALVREGEKWSKNRAKSCIIATILNAIIVFVAAITIPDCYTNTFRTVATSYALSLFSSVASILIFLAILTAHYREEDFLYALPKMLILGHLCLFLSIASMMIIVSCIIYLLFGTQKAWIFIPVALSAWLPLTIFATTKFPLLVSMIKSTYGPSIFGKKSHRQLY